MASAELAAALDCVQKADGLMREASELVVPGLERGAVGAPGLERGAVVTPGLERGAVGAPSLEGSAIVGAHFLYQAYEIMLKLSDLVRKMSPTTRSVFAQLLATKSEHITLPLIKHFAPAEHRLFFEFGTTESSLRSARGMFFPDAMAAGPEPDAGAGPMSVRRNQEIALTCALMSVLSYRSPDEMSRAAEACLPVDLTILSVQHRETESDAYVFVDGAQRFAIVVVRGTEIETVRDWATSVDMSMEAIPGQSPDNTRARTSYLNAATAICHQTTVTVGAGPNAGVRPPSPLLEYLRGMKPPPPKLYLTGHSLGGGVASIMGLVLASAGLVPDAVVTFGSPQVGDRAFKLRCEQTIGCIWRFVHGDEFAPMSPPIPFRFPKSDGRGDERDDVDQYRHVGTLVETKPPYDGFSNADTDRNIQQAADRLAKMARDDSKLFDCVTDHDPINQIRWLLGQMHLPPI